MRNKWDDPLIGADSLVLGTDGIRIWSMKAKTPLALPPPQNLRGSVTCAKWVSHREESHKLICFGTSLGWFVFWKQQSEHVRMVPLISGKHAYFGVSNHFKSSWGDVLGEDVR